MNINIKLIILATILFGAIGISHSEIIRHENFKAKPEMNNVTIIDRPDLHNSDYIYKKNQLRCWQDGDLIVVENGWQPTEGYKKVIMSKENKNLYFYDYGETFCLYTEG